ncbi:hypothetical protein DPEC_G00087970 [Dallia pectoralis]|uniref:Uncharacterized protein n=1 Tax=Dallia pectoralis TaxID=75939 RepID=A0ACC2H063_DALPE|nr:hypothetical protein DPEC_G00087970 [Dallia pectoralis]
MGCSPSKGHLFPGVANGVHKALLPGPPEPRKVKSAMEENTKIVNMETDKEVQELPLSAEVENHMPCQGKVVDEVPNTVIVKNPGTVCEKEVEMMSQVREHQSEDLPGKEKKKDRLKNKALKQGHQKEKETNTSITHGKMDLPIHMVRAHQAAYEYLNPNISRCENLLGLLELASQNQLSLRPMMNTIVMRFEEITQALEMMAEDGERMLKEHGDHMAWPSETKTSAPISVKPNVESCENPPDLLQLLLQHSTEKMKLVGSSIRSLGDTALEDGADYFASLSELLARRLQAKHAVEARLAQVLARVEAAAKCNLDDMSLHSDDSGFGGESESLTGSERQRRQWGRCGSGGSARPTPPSQSPDQVCLDIGKEEDEDDEDDKEEVRSVRPRSNSSPPDTIQTPERSGRQLSKRPQTSAPSGRPERPPRSQSIESLHLQELQQKDLCQQGNDTLRRHSSEATRVSRNGLNGSLNKNQAPSSLPAITPCPPVRNSVKRLINTFSGGVDGRPGQSLPSAHLRGSRRSGTTPLPGIGSGVVSGNHGNNSWPVEGRDDLDMDNLPPPPPEVLMDNSYESTDENSSEEEGKEEEGKDVANGRSHPLPRQRSAASQRLKASLQSIAVLPNRGSVRPVKQEPRALGERQSASERDQESEQAAYLYRQARKIIHLRNAAETTAERSDLGGKGPLRAGVGLSQGSHQCEGEYSPANIQPTLPPVSRVRLPPSCPSTHHRLPSPPGYAQPSAQSRPTSPRLLRWSKESSGEEDMRPSVSFNVARSVFCQNTESISQTPSCSSILPRPYGELPRGRMSSRGSQNVIRRSQSDQRASLTTQKKESSNQGPLQTWTRGSEPNITNSSERMVKGLVMDGNNQPDPSAVGPNDPDPDEQ